MNVGTYTRNRVIGEETISAPKMGAGANVYRLTVTSETEMVLFRVDISQVRHFLTLSPYDSRETKKTGRPAMNFRPHTNLVSSFC